MRTYVLIISHPSQPNRVVELKTGYTAIGRAADNNIVLDGMQVSGRHVHIYCSAERCTITDEKSTNGTKVNGEALVPHVERELKPGDRIEIGPYTITFARSQPAAHPSRTDPVAASAVAAQPPPPRRQPSPEFAFTQSLPTVRLRSAYLTRLPRKGERSVYFDLLPPFYEIRDLESEAQILHGLLLICQSIMQPLDQMIDQLHYYVDADVAPERMLPWLAAWVDLVLNENWPLQRRRELIRRAVELYRRRGTRAGLRDYLHIYTGVLPTIVEPGEEEHFPLPTQVVRVLPTAPGEQVQVAATDVEDLLPLPEATFRLVLDLTGSVGVDLSLVRQIIEAEKPAHTSYMLYLHQTLNK